MDKVLVATDFSPAADHALQMASKIAKAANWEVQLLHINGSNSAKLLEKRGKKLNELNDFMAELASESTSSSGVKCHPLCRRGNLFVEVNAEASNPEYQLMVIGTHGSKGLRQALFGADILKMAKTLPLPMLALSDNAFIHEKGIRKILFPYGGHARFDNKVKATALLAKLFDAEVVIYSIQRFANSVSQETLENVRKAHQYFDEMGVRNTTAKDDMESFSIGFAKRTLDYAKENEFDIIAIMSTASDEYSFLSSVDKENMINNSDGICILMTSDF
jgi:nucleotide-binding universal stress UspA family protein